MTALRLLDTNPTSHWIEPHDIAAMRQHADNLPWDAQRVLHALLDAWEDAGDAEHSNEEFDEVAKEAGDTAVKLEDATNTIEEFRAAARAAYDALDDELNEELLVSTAREELDNTFKFEPCGICPSKASDLFDAPPSISGAARCKAHGRPAEPKHASESSRVVQEPAKRPGGRRKTNNPKGIKP